GAFVWLRLSRRLPASRDSDGSIVTGSGLGVGTLPAGKQVCRGARRSVGGAAAGLRRAARLTRRSAGRSGRIVRRLCCCRGLCSQNAPGLLPDAAIVRIVIISTEYG